MLFQIAIITFAVLMLLRTWTQQRAQKVAKQWLALWAVIWIVIIAVALAPQTADVIASVVGVGRGADLFVYIAILFLLYAEYRSLVRTKKLQEQQTELVRRIAIDRAEVPRNEATEGSPEGTRELGEK